MPCTHERSILPSNDMFWITLLSFPVTSNTSAYQVQIPIISFWERQTHVSLPYVYSLFLLPFYTVFLPLIVRSSSLSLSSSGNINVKMPSNKTQLTEEEVQGWGLNEVSGWLKSAKLESCIEEFSSLQIDGQRLLVNKQCIIA